MSRIKGRDARGWFGYVVYWQCKRLFGRVPSSVRLLAHHRRVFAGAVRMEQALSAAKALPSRLKTLVELRVASRVGCSF